MSSTSLEYAGCIYSADSWDKVVDLDISIRKLLRPTMKDTGNTVTPCF